MKHLKHPHNVVDILACCSALWKDGEVREVRTFPDAIIEYGTKKSGYFDTPQAIAAALQNEAGEEYEAIFLTLNPCTPALLARAKNRMKKKPKYTTKDDDIIDSTLQLIDVDPVRPAGICSTDEEKAHAKAIMKTLIKDLGEPILLQDSGNGYHAIYRTDQPDPVARSQFLKMLDEKYSNEHAKIDISVFNPSRLFKIAGTWARKGDEIDGRPYRIGKVIRVNSQSPILHIESSIQPATASKKATKATKTQTSKANTADQQHNIELVRRLCDENSLSIIKEKAWGTGHMFQLAECVFDPGHSGNEASFIVHASGEINYQCFHDSCKGRLWSDVKARYSVSKPQAQVESEIVDVFAPAKKEKKEKEHTRYATQGDWNALFFDLKWQFATDQLTWCVLLNRKRLDDPGWSRIRRAARDWLTAHGLRRDMKDFEDAVYNAASKVIVNEIREYLEGLKWDGVDHFAELAAYIDTDVGVEKLARMFEIWFASSIRRVYEPCRGLCLVLQGGENIGKSSFVRWLCPLDPDRFLIQGDIRTEDKDCRMRCAASLIWELAEIDKTIRKQDVSALKNFISQTSFKERKPWGKEDVIFQPVCNFIGTVNPDVFLMDTGGNSRFIVAKVRNLCWDYEKVNKDQLWAQAVVVYGQKKYVMSSAENIERTEHNQEFTSKMTFEQYLDEALIKDSEGGDVAITTIIDYLAVKKITFARNNELWNYIKARGFERKRKRLGEDLEADRWQVVVKSAKLMASLNMEYKRGVSVPQEQYQNQY